MTALLASDVRCGDVVRHIPSGDDWIVAWAEGDRLAPAGWPESTAPIADCEMVSRIDDFGHCRSVIAWRAVRDDSRPARVERLYGAAVR